MKNKVLNKPKEIILCADDYAQNNAISQGILTLVKSGRINAVSCLVNSAAFDETHTDLLEFRSRCFIGLHLNLTLGQPRSAMWRTHAGELFDGLPTLLSNAYLKRLDLRVVQAELQAQLDVFVNAMQFYPDFIDGHQHIHQFPVVRTALLNIYREQKMSCFLRNTYNGWTKTCRGPGLPKTALLAVLGGARFKQTLIQEAIPANTSFSGVYSFAHAKHYRNYFKRFLAQIMPGGLIMCHPGVKSQDHEDPLLYSRPYEHAYFMSDVFVHDMQAYSCSLMDKKR